MTEETTPAPVPVTELGLPKQVADALVAAELDDVVKLNAFRAEHPLTDITGIGAPSAKRIAEALDGPQPLDELESGPPDTPPADDPVLEEPPAEPGHAHAPPDCRRYDIVVRRDVPCGDAVLPVGAKVAEIVLPAGVDLNWLIDSYRNGFLREQTE